MVFLSNPIISASGMVGMFGTGLFAYEVVLTSLLVGVLLVAILSAVDMMRERASVEKEIKELIQENSSLRARVEHNEKLLDADDQLILTWDYLTNKPNLIGALGPAAASPKHLESFLRFESWLTQASADELDQAVKLLCESGKPFTIDLATVSSTFVEACGRTGGGRPFVRFRDLTVERVDFAFAKDKIRALSDELLPMRRLFELLPWPVWFRDVGGELSSVNSAYATAVEAGDPLEAVRMQSELLDSAGLAKLEKCRSYNELSFAKHVAVVIAGQRRLLDVVDIRSATGGVGIAVDISELKHAKDELKRTRDFHANTLDQLTTAVAIFGSDRRLKFYNAAYQSLWKLDTLFLESNPEDGNILDELRANRRLPEQPDWREWKRNMLAGYTSMESNEHWLHLPDGQTLRVVATPYSRGGVAYFYENMTRTLELETRNNALIWVQRETLDHLSEGVAVFSSDGRLRLWNPSFIDMWQLDENLLQNYPHITEVINYCADTLNADSESWAKLKIAVTGLSDTRHHFVIRMDRVDGLIFDVRTIPLPDGGTLFTLVNVTDTVNVEMALREKNEALETSNRIKTDFVGLVSYELRSPLTNIVGFAHLVNNPITGPLNDKQREYLGYVMSSAQALMVIVDDILDLATIEAGTMRLNVAAVDVANIISVTVEALRDRIASAGIRVITDVQAGIGRVFVDPHRIKQVLFNLLSNALRSSYSGSTVLISAWKKNGEFTFVVADEGSALSSDELQKIFECRYSLERGAHFRVDSLALSLVKSFIELHGGTVCVSSANGVGTVFTCRLPVSGALSADKNLISGATG